MSVLLAALIGFEMFSSDKLDEAQSLDKQAQIPLIAAEQMQPVARHMVERTAQGAARDPALKDLLAKYGFQIKITPVHTADAAPVPAPVNGSPSL